MVSHITKVKKSIALALSLVMVATLCPIPAYAADPDDPSKEEVGFLVMGDDVRGTDGFKDNIVYLTSDEVENLKTNKNPEDYGLGDSWADDQRFSSYDNHGAGGYHYSIVDGIEVEAILDALVPGGFESLDKFSIFSGDGYSTTMTISEVAKQKYFAPGDQTGRTGTGPMIAYYKSSLTSQDQSSGVEPSGPAERTAKGKEVFVYGQETLKTDNNCNFIKYVNVLLAGTSEERPLKSDNERLASRKTNDIITLGVCEKDYTFTDGSGQKTTHRVKGIPMIDVLEDMDIYRYMPSFSSNKLQLVDIDGNTKTISRSALKDCYVVWGYADDTETPEGQTTELAVYMKGDTLSETMFCNLRELNVVNSKGNAVTSVPTLKKPTLKASLAGTKAKLKISNISGEDGYEIQRKAGTKGKWKTVKTLKANKTTWTSGTLSKGKNHYYRVRAFSNEDSGKVYSSWSSTKKVRRR